jgi:hypothetical protein
VTINSYTPSYDASITINSTTPIVISIKVTAAVDQSGDVRVDATVSQLFKNTTLQSRVGYLSMTSEFLTSAPTPTPAPGTEQGALVTFIVQTTFLNTLVPFDVTPTPKLFLRRKILQNSTVATTNTTKPTPTVATVVKMIASVTQVNAWVALLPVQLNISSKRVLLNSHGNNTVNGTLWKIIVDISPRLATAMNEMPVSSVLSALNSPLLQTALSIVGVSSVLKPLPVPPTPPEPSVLEEYWYIWVIIAVVLVVAVSIPLSSHIKTKYIPVPKVKLKGNLHVVDAPDENISRDVGRNYMIDERNKEKAKHHQALVELPPFQGQLQKYYDHWENPQPAKPPPTTAAAEMAPVGAAARPPTTAPATKAASKSPTAKPPASTPPVASKSPTAKPPTAAAPGPGALPGTKPLPT